MKTTNLQDGIKYEVEVLINDEIIDMEADKEQLESLNRQGIVWTFRTNEEIDETVLVEKQQDEVVVYSGREFKITPKGFIYENINNKFTRVSKASFNQAMQEDPSNFFKEDTKEKETNAWCTYKEKFASFGLNKESIEEEFGKAYYLAPTYDNGQVYYGRYLVKDEGHFYLVSEMLRYNGDINLTEEKDIHPYLYTLAIDSEFKASKKDFKFRKSLSFETKDGKFIETYEYNFFGLKIGCMVLDNKVIKYKALPKDEDKQSALKNARKNLKRRRQEALDEMQTKQCNEEYHATPQNSESYGGFSHGNKYLDREEA